MIADLGISPTFLLAPFLLLKPFFGLMNFLVVNIIAIADTFSLVFFYSFFIFYWDNHLIKAVADRFWKSLSLKFYVKLAVNNVNLWHYVEWQLTPISLHLCKFSWWEFMVTESQRNFTTGIREIHVRYVKY